MLNKCTRTELMAAPIMKEAYEKEYTSYIADKEVLQCLKPLMVNKQIIIVMGDWCSDSQTEVPRFYKLLDQLGVEDIDISLIAVNELKKAEDGLIDELEIVSVPTFILMEENKEIGRIIEKPVLTLEKDVLAIVLNN